MRMLLRCNLTCLLTVLLTFALYFGVFIVTTLGNVYDEWVTLGEDKETNEIRAAIEVRHLTSLFCLRLCKLFILNP